MYKWHNGVCSMILEAVADCDMWIRQALVGMASSHNYNNILQQSLVFTILTEGNAPLINYVINGHTYTQGYYLADGIYPQW
jgi:hypothetical protein